MISFPNSAKRPTQPSHDPHLPTTTRILSLGRGHGPVRSEEKADRHTTQRGFIDVKTAFPIPRQCSWGIKQLAYDLRLLLTSPRLELPHLNALTGLALGVSRLPDQTKGLNRSLEIPGADRGSFFIRLTDQEFEFRVWHLEVEIGEGHSLIEDFSFTLKAGDKEPTLNICKFDEHIHGVSCAVACFLYPYHPHPAQMPVSLNVSAANDQIDWSVYEKTSQNERDLTDE